MTQLTQEDRCRNQADLLIDEINNARHWMKNHKPSLGAYGEYILMEALKELLPNTYEICQGFVIGSKGCCSKQCDIIIYKQNGFIIRSFGYTKFVKAESVIAVIEVKSSVTENTFHSSLKAFEQLNKLGVINTYLFVYDKLSGRSISKWFISYRSTKLSVCQDNFIAYDNDLYDWPDKEWLPNAIVSLDGCSLYSSFIGTFDNGDWFSYMTFNILDGSDKQVSSLQEFFQLILSLVNVKYSIDIEHYSKYNSIQLFRI